MKPSRYPSLQIPASTPADLRAFLEGVKERLEITTGDRGDPRDRLLTVRDVEAAGMATVTVRNKFATLSGGATAKSVAALMSDSGTTGTFDGVLAPSLETLTESQVADATDFITYNNTVARLQRVPYQTLRALFLHEDSDAELTGNWQFQNEELALEISAEVPRFRFTESSSTEVLPTDGNVWDWTVDDQLMSLLLVSDDQADSTSMLELGRDGLDPSFIALVNGTILQIQDGTAADPGLTFDDDIDTGLFRPTDDALAVSTAGGERLRVTNSGLVVSGTAVLTALTGHLDVTPSAAANFAALKVRNNAGTEIWRLNSETDGDLDFARQSGTGLLRLNGVALIDAALFTTGTLDDARLSANVPLKNTANVFTAANTFNLTPTVPDDSWVYAKLQNVSATSRVLGRITAGAGDIEELTGANVATIVGYTAGDVLTKLLTVDGAGSLLDADFLDSISSAGFFQTANVLLAVDGTAGAPTYSFASDAASGWYRIGAANIGASVNAVNVLDLAATVSKLHGSSETLQLVLGSTTGIGSFAGINGIILAASSTSQVRIYARAAAAGLNAYRINGTSGSPTAVVSGNNIFAFNALGATDTTPTLSSGASLQMTATENWSSTNRGCRINFNTTATGSTVATTTCIYLGTQAQFLDATAAAPAVTFQNDLDCGLYRIGANQLGIATNGTLVLDISTGTFAVTATTVRLNTTTATTVGAAGAAAALPANPLGYISANIGGTAVKIPYYNN